MIVMNFKADNFFAFDDFSINFSYPKKIVNSYIEDEHLLYRPNFRYKRVNVMMGANATGKTAFGDILKLVFNFLYTKNPQGLIQVINNKENDSYISIDLVSNYNDITDSYSLFRVNIKVDVNAKLELDILQASINKTDSYEKCVDKLKLIQFSDEDSYIIKLNKLDVDFCWHFSQTDEHDKIMETDEDSRYLNVLKVTLMTLDPSIIDVTKINGVKNTYVIITENYELIIQDDQVIKENKLSSGTKNGIDIAKIIYSITSNIHKFYYCDEKFPYIHTDLEKAFLCIMASHLQPNNQLFFTTHNTEIADIPFPKHTFTFFKKQKKNEKYVITTINAATLLKRNTDSLKHAIENDLFSSSPDLSLLDALE